MSTKKRRRRTNNEMDNIRAHVHELCSTANRTIRGLFYQLIARGVIEKDEREYTGLSRVVADMRKEGDLPWDWIVDGTRVSRKPNLWGSMNDFARDASSSFRLNFWKRETVQVWCEKSTVSGLIHPITDNAGVAFATVNGQSSLTFLHAEAEKINDLGLPATIYLFGDFDPSGLVSRKNIINKITEYAPDVPLTFHEAAITAEQVIEYDLPTRPTKKEGNRHAQSKHWTDGDNSVELDALPSDKLEDLVTGCIANHIDPAELEAHTRVELQLKTAVKQAILALPETTTH